MDWLIPLITLTALEIVLGLDNVIFLSILVSRLPSKNQQSARQLGLFFAMFTRIALLLSLAWVSHLTAPFIRLFDYALTGRQLILVLGGLFLIAKSTHEIHQAFEKAIANKLKKPRTYKAVFWTVVLQIAILDIVFSFDSVITAVGMVNQISIMVSAIVLSVFVMLFAAKTVGNFIEKYPTLKMLALSFLILIGVALLADGFGLHIPRQYLYFAMSFSVFVEFLNIKIRGKK